MVFGDILDQMMLFWSDVIDGKYPYNPRKTSLIEKEDREKYEKFLPKNLKRNKVIDYLKCFYSDTEIKEDIINYMIPLVCADLPITPIEAIKFFDIKDFEQLDIIEQTRLFWFYKFYKYRIGKLKTLNLVRKKKRLENFQALLQKYLVGKEITILPSGIKLSMNGKSISLNELASGEKKIILLFALACLCDNLEILLDEPELSLSIVWQEDLLVDMLSSNRNFYTIATHSPYMVAKEEIQKIHYIFYRLRNKVMTINEAVKNKYILFFTQEQPIGVIQRFNIIRATKPKAKLYFL